MQQMMQQWTKMWNNLSETRAPHEAGRLHLQINKAYHKLGWRPRWSFSTTVARTGAWYRDGHGGANPVNYSRVGLGAFTQESANAC